MTSIAPAHRRRPAVAPTAQTLLSSAWYGPRTRYLLRWQRAVRAGR